MAGQNNKGLHNNEKLLTFRFSNNIFIQSVIPFTTLWCS